MRFYLGKINKRCPGEDLEESGILAKLRILVEMTLRAQASKKKSRLKKMEQRNTIT